MDFGHLTYTFHNAQIIMSERPNPRYKLLHNRAQIHHYWCQQLAFLGTFSIPGTVCGAAENNQDDKDRGCLSSRGVQCMWWDKQFPK